MRFTMIIIVPIWGPCTSQLPDALLIHQSALQPFEEVIITLILYPENDLWMKGLPGTEGFPRDWTLSANLGKPQANWSLGLLRGNQGSQCHKSRIESELMPKIS